MDKKKVTKIAMFVCGAATVVFAVLSGISQTDTVGYITAVFAVATVIASLLKS